MTTTTILSDNGVSSGSAGIKTTGGNDGVLALQTTTAGGAATTAVTIDTSQNVGIGNTSPETLSTFRFLDVGSSGSNQGVLQANNGTVKAALYVNGTTGNLATRTSHNLALQTNGTTAVTIDTSQNVGIGLSSPYSWSKVQVNGYVVSNGTTFQNTYETIQTNAYYSSGWKYIANGAAWGIGDNFGGPSGGVTIALAPTNSSGANAALTWSPKVAIDSSGNFIVGTNTTSYAKLTVNGADGDQLALNNAGTQYTSMYFRNNGTLKTSVYWDNTNTKYVVQPTLGGVQLVNNTTAWAAISDTRLKNITGIYTNALDDIQQIEAIKFTWKSDESNRPQVGVTAQSVQKVIPEAIDIGTINNEDDTQYLSVRYTEIIPLMIAAIQEQQALITQLQADVAALKGA